MILTALKAMLLAAQLALRKNVALRAPARAVGPRANLLRPSGEIRPPRWGQLWGPSKSPLFASGNSYCRNSGLSVLGSSGSSHASGN